MLPPPFSMHVNQKYAPHCQLHTNPLTLPPAESELLMTNSQSGTMIDSSNLADPDIAGG